MTSSGLGRALAALALVAGLAAGGAHAQQPAAARPAAPDAQAKAPEYVQQILVPGSWFHGVHGIAFNKDDQLFAGSVVGQAIYRVNVDSGDVSQAIDPPQGMADDIAFAPDGTMAWTAFLLGKVYVRRPNGQIREVASGLPGANSLAFNRDGKLYVSQVFLGDALWEIDLKGVDAQGFEPFRPEQLRKVAENLGGLNGFEFNKDDGLLYGPLWFKGSVVKIDVAKGDAVMVANAFKIPAAVNFDSKGNLFVVDTALGQLWRVTPSSGERTLIATLKPGLDNLAIDTRDRVFVTSMVDNGIYQVDTATGNWRTVVEGRLAIPSDIAVASEDGRETLHVADVFSYRTVDGRTGQVRDVLRMQGDPLEYPMGIDVGPRHVLLTSWFTNSVQKIDRRSGKSVAMLQDFKAPVDAAELADGALLVLELGTGSLLRVSGATGAERTVIADGLAAPAALATDGASHVYISELGRNAVLHIDLSTGARRTVADNIAGPEGLDIGPDGRVYVAEVGARRVIALDPRTGERWTVAGNLAIGLPTFDKGPPAFVTTGVAVGKSGAVYVASDLRNAIYKLTPR